MKKSSSKLIVSGLIAAMMISASAVCVSAIDYGPVKPDSYTPVSPATTVSDKDKDETAANDDAVKIDATGVVTEKIMESVIEKAIESGQTEVSLTVAPDSDTNKVTVQESAIADIAKSNVNVTFNIQPAEGVAYSVTIDPKTIKSAKAVNLAMDIMTGPAISAVASSMDLELPDDDMVLIKPQMKGKFGMELTVTLPAAAFNGMDLKDVAVLYIDDDGVASLENIPVKVNTDGSVSVVLSHASAYLLVSSDFANKALDIDDDPAELDDDDDPAELDDDEDYDESDGNVAAIIDEGDNNDSTPIVEAGESGDENPGTGVGLALGAVAVSAAAVFITKKRK